jgi:hypothetical protein
MDYIAREVLEESTFQQHLFATVKEIVKLGKMRNVVMLTL